MRTNDYEWIPAGHRLRPENPCMVIHILIESKSPGVQTVPRLSGAAGHILRVTS